MRQRLLHQCLDGFVVEHVTAVVDETVLPVRGVRIECDIGDHAQFGEALLERTHGALHEAVVGPGGFGGERLRFGRGDREQRERGHA